MSTEIGSIYFGLGISTAEWDRQVPAIGAAADAVGDRITRGFQRGSAAVDKFEISIKQTRAAAANLTAQLGDVATSLASGSSPGRVIMQQFDQIRMAVSQAGGVAPAMRAIGASISGIVTPTTAAVAGVAALGAGFGFLLLRSTETEARLRSFDVILHGMATTSTASAAGLDQVYKKLRDSGTAAGDAEKAVQSFARISGINPGSAGTLLPLARDIGAVTGADMTAVATRMAQALATSTDAAVKLVFELAGPNGLTEAQVKVISSMSAAGNKIGAYGIMIDALKERFGGSFEASMSSSAKAITSIGAAWENMLDKLSNTRPVRGAQDAVVGLMNGIADAAAGKTTGALPPAPAVSVGGTGSIPGAAQAMANRRRLGLEPPALSAGGGVSNLVAAMIQVESGGNPNRVSPKGAMGLMQLMPGTAADLGVANPFDPGQNVAGGTSYVQQLIAKYGDVHTALMAYNWGPGNVDKYLAGRTSLPPKVSAYANNVLSLANNGARSLLPADAAPGFRTGLTSHSGVVGAPLDTHPAGNGPTNPQLIALGQLKEHLADIDKATAKLGDDKVWWQAYFETLGPGIKGVDDIWAAMTRANDAVARHHTELQKAADTQDIANRLGLQTAKIYGSDVVAGLQAETKAQAELKVRAGEAMNVFAEQQRLLQTGFVAAAQSAAQAIPSLKLQTQQTEALATALGKSEAAGNEAEVQAKAAVATQGLWNAAKALGTEESKKFAQAVTDETLALYRQQRAGEVAIMFRRQNTTDRNDAEAIRLQVQLAGQSQETIDREVALLRVRQQVAGLPDFDQKMLDTKLATTNALYDQIDALSRTRSQMQQLSEYGSVFESSFSRAFDAVGEGTFKLRDQVAALSKDLLKTVASQAFRSLLNGPTGSGGGLIGMAFGALGFGGDTVTGDYGGGWDLPGVPHLAGGGTFRVGGSGFDNQLFQAYLNPGEMVKIDPANDRGGGGSEEINLNLRTDAGLIADIADQRIVTRSGQIITVAVQKSQAATQRNFRPMRLGRVAKGGCDG